MASCQNPPLPFIATPRMPLFHRSANGLLSPHTTSPLSLCSVTVEDLILQDQQKALQAPPSAEGTPLPHQTPPPPAPTGSPLGSPTTPTTAQLMEFMRASTPKGLAPRSPQTPLGLRSPTAAGPPPLPGVEAGGGGGGSPAPKRSAQWLPLINPAHVQAPAALQQQVPPVEPSLPATPPSATPAAIADTPGTKDALEGKVPQRRPQRRLDRRLEEVAKAVGAGYCRLQMPLKLAHAVRETVAGHRLAPWRGGRGYPPPPLPMHPRQVPPAPPALRPGGFPVCRAPEASPRACLVVGESSPPGSRSLKGILVNCGCVFLQHLDAPPLPRPK